MKIEKISENQIKCTLTRDDLASRKINLQELAYGSEKAKMLFQDMMQEAFREYGFTVDNSPLMIEAIPLSGEAIVLIITRVDNPEELDSRFARFSHEDGNSDFSESPSDVMSSLDDIVSMISKLASGSKASDKKKRPAVPDKGSTADADIQSLRTVSDVQPEAGSGFPEASAEGSSQAFNLTRFFLFRDLETIIRAASTVTPDYHGWNSLFKNPDDGNYYLILRMGDTPPQEFNRVCNVLTEYGVAVNYTSGMEEFFTEHMHTITSENALQVLKEL